MAKDFYQILGVPKTASKDEIKRAYRRLAHEYHPDKGGGEAQKFKEVNEAYEALSDDAKRAQYDRFGQTFDQAGQGSGFGGFTGDFSQGFDFGGFSAGNGSTFSADFSDIFSDIFGGGRKTRKPQGIDLEMNLDIEFLESVTGLEKKINLEKKDACQHCKGQGAEPGTEVITCPKCHGQGQIITHRRTILGNMQSAQTCDRCDGTGKIPEKPCRECVGAGIKRQTKTITINIPAGIDSGQRIRLTGEGEMGYRGTKPGDLYIQIRVKAHPEFIRDGFDIRSEIPISFYGATLGGETEVATVDGPVMLKIPAGIQSGKILRLAGKGVPHLDHKTRRGDHLVTVRIVTPQKLTKKEKELLKTLAEESGETVNVNKSFWGKIKDSF